VVAAPVAESDPVNAFICVPTCALHHSGSTDPLFEQFLAQLRLPSGSFPNLLLGPVGDLFFLLEG